jgi:hypothetical protein
MNFLSLAIERHWNAAKRYARSRTPGSIVGLRKLFPEALDSVPSSEIRAFFRKSARFLSIHAVVRGCPPALAENLASEKSFRSHRRVGQNDLERLVAKLRAGTNLPEKAAHILGELCQAMGLEKK